MAADGKSLWDSAIGESDLWPELYEERAAIKQYMGGMSREQAEREAKLEIDALRAPKEALLLDFD
jgi:hypothetical protein